MSGADRLEDGYPHGTVDGYAQGCRGGWCPAGNEHGLSCRKAKQLAAADYQFQRLVKAGRSPFEIAFELGLMPETHGVPGRKKAAAVADEVDLVDEKVEVGPVDEQGSEQQGGFEKFVKPKRSGHQPPPALSASMSKEERAALRTWAAENGLPAPERGRIPNSTVEAYTAAHAVSAAPAPKPPTVGLSAPVTVTSGELPLPESGKPVDLPAEIVGEGALPVYDPADPGPHETEAHGVAMVEEDPALESVEPIAASDVSALVVYTSETAYTGGWDAAEEAYAPAVDAMLRAEAALELALRKWAAEQDRRKGQSRLIRSLASQVIAAEYERRADAEVLASMDRAYAEALARIDELQAEVIRLRGPWWKRGAA